MREIEDRRIVGAIKLREDVGFRSITNGGEFRTTGWSTGLLKALVTLQDGPTLFEVRDAAGNVQRSTPPGGATDSPRGLSSGEYEFVRLQTAHTEGHDAAPSFPHFFEGAIVQMMPKRMRTSINSGRI